MRREIIQCDTCAKQHDLKELLPAGWVTLTQRSHYDQHFCSYVCHAVWAREHFGMSLAEPASQPQSKMRRFVLVDGVTADETEGVKWSDGRVTLESRGCSLETWEDFKFANQDSGVTWIDQEIKEEELAHAAD